MENHDLVESISVKGSYFAEVEVVGKQGVISFQWSSFIFFYYLFVPVFIFFPLSSLNLHQCHFTRMRKTKKEQKNTSQSEIHITSHFPPTSTSQNNAPLM